MAIKLLQFSMISRFLCNCRCKIVKDFSFNNFLIANFLPTDNGTRMDRKPYSNIACIPVLLPGLAERNKS